VSASGQDLPCRRLPNDDLEPMTDWMIPMAPMPSMASMLSIPSTVDNRSQIHVERRMTIDPWPCLSPRLPASIQLSLVLLFLPQHPFRYAPSCRTSDVFLLRDIPALGRFGSPYLVHSIADRHWWNALPTTTPFCAQGNEKIICVLHHEPRHIMSRDAHRRQRAGVEARRHDVGPAYTAVVSIPRMPQTAPARTSASNCPIAQPSQS
jgi:hypothetical protein